MKFRFSTLILLLSVALYLPAQAQKTVVPEHYSFDDNDGYRKYANDILKCVGWLETTKLADDDSRYVEAVNFLGEWVSGCPYINYTTNVRIDAVFNGTPELRIYNKAGWARNAIENNYKSSQLENYLAGVRCALKVYKANASINRSKSMDALIDTERAGKLKEWVADRL